MFVRQSLDRRSLSDCRCVRRPRRNRPGVRVAGPRLVTTGFRTCQSKSGSAPEQPEEGPELRGVAHEDAPAAVSYAASASGLERTAKDVQDLPDRSGHELRIEKIRK